MAELAGGTEQCRVNKTSNVECGEEAAPMCRDIRREIEENALRSAIYRSARSGWTNSDRSRPPQQPQDTAVRDSATV